MNNQRVGVARLPINELTIKLLLMLAVRKGELVTAKVSAFDLDAGTWKLTTADTKTKSEIIIPLPKQAVECLRDLVRLADGNEYLLPARQYQDRRLPYIHENTLNVALSKVKANMPGVEPFTIHDFRRTARTHLAALGKNPILPNAALTIKSKASRVFITGMITLTNAKQPCKYWLIF